MATTENATILRRVAQLIEDLRTVRLLSESDSVDFHYNGKKSICISLSLSSYSNPTHIRPDINKAFVDEFGFDNVITQTKNMETMICFTISYDR